MNSAAPRSWARDRWRAIVGKYTLDLRVVRIVLSGEYNGLSGAVSVQDAGLRVEQAPRACF